MKSCPQSVIQELLGVAGQLDEGHSRGHDGRPVHQMCQKPGPCPGSA